MCHWRTAEAQTILECAASDTSLMVDLIAGCRSMTVVCDSAMVSTTALRRADVDALIQQADRLAASLSARRHYVMREDERKRGQCDSKGDDGEGKEEGGESKNAASGAATETRPELRVFDARFLVFEFLFGHMLRDMQIDLVRRFVSDAKAGRSRVAQLLMGAGKTSVVAPLLSLFLATPTSLVSQVVPPALLGMSRQLLTAHFSFVVPKPVFTFQFDRSVGAHGMLEVTQLRRKLALARACCGVVITTPSALKSLQLRFVETLMRSPMKPNGSNCCMVRCLARNSQAFLVEFTAAGVSLGCFTDLMFDTLGHRRWRSSCTSSCGCWVTECW